MVFNTTFNEVTGISWWSRRSCICISENDLYITDHHFLLASLHFSVVRVFPYIKQLIASWDIREYYTSLNLYQEEKLMRWIIITILIYFYKHKLTINDHVTRQDKSIYS